MNGYNSVRVAEKNELGSAWNTIVDVPAGVRYVLWVVRYMLCVYVVGICCGYTLWVYIVGICCGWRVLYTLWVSRMLCVCVCVCVCVSCDLLVLSKGKTPVCYRHWVGYPASR